MSDPRAALEARLAPHYTVEREVGRGGMATVYRAVDRRHDRLVALKVLHPELALSVNAERFRQEIRLAGRLQHPNILAVYDSGERDGLFWFSMPFVDGESLRDRIAREGPLPVDEALRIAREVADALGYAHRHGVIHRDVKPENIMLSSGHALLGDFGVARAIERAGAARITPPRPPGAGPAPGPPERMTATGTIVGTLVYMSPEQVEGEAELDGRADLYALGCVLYEMLSGDPPFTGSTPQAVMARALRDTPPPIRTRRPEVPAALQAVIERVVAKQPDQRFPDAEAFMAALDGVRAGPAPEPPTASRPAGRRRRWGLAAIGLVLLGLVTWGLRDRASGPEEPPLIAVLPFRNLGEPADVFFADGVTDDVRGKLASLAGLQVIAGASTSQYRASPPDLRAVARDLGVEYVLLGAVQWPAARDGGRTVVRVSPELVRVSRDGPPVTVWREPFQAEVTDVFRVQGQIAGEVARRLNVVLTASDQQLLERPPTLNLAAYEAYRRAEDVRALVTGTATDLRQAIQYYEQAVALDSTFALAWARLGRARALLYVNAISDTALARASLAAAERAAALAPDRPEPYVALGYHRTFIANEPEAAVEVLTAGLAVAPNDPDILAWLGAAEMTLGRWDTALRHLTAATRLDPRSIGAARRLAQCHLWLRRYPEALEASERAIRLAPLAMGLHQIRAMVYLARGDLAGARRVLRDVPPEVEPTARAAYMANYWDLFWALDDDDRDLLLRLSPSAFGEDRAWWAIILAETYALRGDRLRQAAFADTARQEFERRTLANPTDAQNLAFLGLALGYLGRRDSALATGERATAMLPSDRFGFIGPYYLHLLARTAVLVGAHDQAVRHLETLLGQPYFLSRDWLRIDPTLDPLRQHPGFRRLVSP